MIQYNRFDDMSKDTYISPKRMVRLIYRNDVTNKAQTELDRIKSIISSEGKGFLEIAPKDKTDFQVTINENSEYEIWDQSGVQIPNLDPPLKIDDYDSPLRIVQRLVHLTKYFNIQQMENLNTESPLSHKLVVDLFGVSKDYEPGDRLPELQRIASEGSTKKVKVGQRMVLRIQNSLPKDSNQVLNVTVLDLQPDWGVQQIFPTNLDANFIPLDPGREEYFFLQAGLPSRFMQGKDIIKVFASVNETNFRWLELPQLDQSMRGRKRSVTSNKLELFMETITSDRTITRDLKPSAVFNNEWTTAQIEVEVHRAMTKTPNVKVFISYVREDVDNATRLYEDLKKAGLSPWLDKESILPGQQWKSAIKNAIKDSSYFILLLSSNSIEKRGFIQMELKEAWDVLKELPRAKTSIIPVRLDKSKIKDRRLNDLHAVDLFPEWNKGLKKILSSINIE